MRKIGYARVSPNTQNLDRQIGALRAERCQEVYREKASGKATKFAVLMTLLPSSPISAESVVVGRVVDAAGTQRLSHLVIGSRLRPRDRMS